MHLKTMEKPAPLGIIKRHYARNELWLTNDQSTSDIDDSSHLIVGNGAIIDDYAKDGGPGAV